MRKSRPAGLIALYILGYMIDDFIVFGIALYSIEKLGITHKFPKARNIRGGFLILLLFAPQAIVF